MSQAWVLGVGIVPLVRSVTSGSLFHMVEWTAIGVFLGLLLANERAARVLDLGGAKPTATTRLPELAVSRRTPQLDAGPEGSDDRGVVGFARMRMPQHTIRGSWAGDPTRPWRATRGSAVCRFASTR